jgi:hypothetical protein
MSSAAQSSAVSIPTLRIAPPQGWVDLNLMELWHARELLYFLCGATSRCAISGRLSELPGPFCSPY